MCGDRDGSPECVFLILFGHWLDTTSNRSELERNRIGSGSETDRNRIGTGSEADRKRIGTGSEPDRKRIGSGSEADRNMVSKKEASLMLSRTHMGWTSLVSSLVPTHHMLSFAVPIPIRCSSDPGSDPLPAWPQPANPPSPHGHNPLTIRAAMDMIYVMLTAFTPRRPLRHLGDPPSCPA